MKSLLLPELELPELPEPPPLDELPFTLADAVAEADCEVGGELDAEAVALAEGVGESTLAFVSSLSGQISEAQPAMRETAPPSSRGGGS